MTTRGSVETKISSGEALRIGWIFISRGIAGWIFRKPEVTISFYYRGKR